MIIHSVETVSLKTKDKLLFEFGKIEEEKRVITTKGNKLHKALVFCFTENSTFNDDVTVNFTLEGDYYSLRKTHGDEGKISCSLRLREGDKMQVVARGKNVLPLIESKIEGNLIDLFDADLVSDKVVSDFSGDLRSFKEIEMLMELSHSIAESNKVLAEKHAETKNKIALLYGQSTNKVTRKQIQQIAENLNKTNSAIIDLNNHLYELKSRQESSAITREIIEELSNTQAKYDRVIAQKDEVEVLRQKVKLRDDISVLIPKVEQLNTLNQQRQQIEQSRYNLVEELEWQENELTATREQLDEKIREVALASERRGRLEVINSELATAKKLYELNTKLNEQLVKLTEQLDRLTSDKVMFKNKLSAIEERIAEINDDIERFEAPQRTFSELLEAVRIDVKIDEVSSQIDRTKSEIAIKESNIAEKSNRLFELIKRFKAVAELDKQLTPIKSRKAVVQVLELKAEKLEFVLAQLEEKERTLTRSLEEARYETLQLEHSKGILDKELDKALLRKQEEFKREVFLNSQKVYSDDATSVFAVTADFNDEEINTIKVEIDKRVTERDIQIEKSAELSGKLDEIKRQIAINRADIDTIYREKKDINDHFNQVVAENRNEVVFNYLKALEAGNSTRYLLDLQQETVQVESEINELRSAVENSKLKLKGQEARLKYLVDTEDKLDDSVSSINQLVNSNDQLKDALTDIGENLSGNYEQHRQIKEQMDEIDYKISRIQEGIVEVNKTVKVNQLQISMSMSKAKKYAGSDNLEEAIAKFKYEHQDVESERLLLIESRKNLEKEVFDKRLALTNSQYAVDSKNSEYQELFEELQTELEIKGINLSTLQTTDFNEDTSKIRKTVEEYDKLRQSLAEKITNYYQLLQSQKNVNVEDATKVVSQIAKIQSEIDGLLVMREDLQEKYSDYTRQYLAQQNNKVQLALTAGEAQALNQMKASVRQNEIVKLLIDDKLQNALNPAQVCLDAFSDKKLVLGAEGSMLSVKNGDKVSQYSELDINTKYMVYISLLLGLPNTDGRANWFVFEDKPSVDSEFLTEIMAKIDNINCVIGYNKHKGGVKPSEVAEKVVAPKQQPKKASQPKATAPQQKSEPKEASPVVERKRGPAMIVAKPVTEPTEDVLAEAVATEAKK